MSSEVQSPLYTFIALSLSVVGLVIVGLVSGLIPGVYPATSGAKEPAMQVETKAEAKAEAPGTTNAAIGNLVGTVSAKPEVAADQAGNRTATPQALMADAKKP